MRPARRRGGSGRRPRPRSAGAPRTRATTARRRPTRGGRRGRSRRTGRRRRTGPRSSERTRRGILRAMGRERPPDYADRLPRLVPKEEADISHLSDEMADVLYPGRRKHPFRLGVAFEAFERSIRQIQIEWDKFFSGIEKKPPNDSKTRLEALIRRHANAEIRNNTERFRYQTLTARYNTLNELWSKKLRLREEGKAFGVHGLKAEALPPPPPPASQQAGAHGGRAEQF